MELIDALTVIDYLEASHHEAGYVGFVPVPHLLSWRIVGSLDLSVFYFHLPQPFKSSFESFQVIIFHSIRLRVGHRKGNLLGIWSYFVTLRTLNLELTEVGDQIFKCDCSDGFYLD